MDAPAVPIRTPDQRIRVLVSSTLRELEPERHAVREAVESLHLAPVMFELGARPHPPRSLDEAAARGEPLPGRAEAIALYFSRALAFRHQRDVDLVGGLARSAELFAESSDPSGRLDRRQDGFQPSFAAAWGEAPARVRLQRGGFCASVLGNWKQIEIYRPVAWAEFQKGPLR